MRKCGCPTSESLKGPDSVSSETQDEQKARIASYQKNPGNAADKKGNGCSTGCLWLVGAFFLLAVIGGVITGFEDEQRSNQLKRCNEGISADCQSLLDDSDFEDDQSVTNEAFKQRFVDRKKRRDEANARATRFFMCERAIKESLRDPDSFKVLKRDRVNLLIEYTATNGFGGPVRNVMDCETMRNR